MTYKIIHGDCFEELKKLPDHSVDSVVTDPPYGLSKEPDIREVLTKWLAGEEYDHGHGGFMGKSWDSFVPHPDIWREVYRILKPGGHALVFAGTRTQDLMTVSLRLAGFEVRDVIEWLYFSGFPKSLDVGKQFDKRKGFSMGGFDTEELGHFIKTHREKAGLSRQDASEQVTGRKTGAFWNWENGYCLPSPELWSRIKTVIKAPDSKWDVMFEQAEREKIGEKKSGIANAFGDGEWKSGPAEVVDITAPATDLAKKWDGWGTALKPAHEPIILARKPLDGTVAGNVEKWGTGAINIDGCRIGDTGATTKADTSKVTLSNGIYGDGLNGNCGIAELDKGRFPANCVTTEPDAFFSKYFNVTPPELCKKASKRDRNSDWRGEEIDLPERVKVGERDGRNAFPKNSAGEKGKHSPRMRNTHPTVKPTDLMAWLVRLVTPPGGIVLDPFAGSGSTLVAARREGFGFIGIERELEYVEIAEARAGVAHGM